MFAHGLDTNLLFFCCWADGVKGARLDYGQIRQVMESISGWQEETVRSIWKARWRLRPGFGVFSMERTETLRRKLIEAELDAEHIDNYIMNKENIVMLFKEDDTTQKVFATLPGHDGEELYECDFEICDNPLCMCGIVTVNFLPVSALYDDKISVAQKSIAVDILDRKIDITLDSMEKSPEEMFFQSLMREHLNDEDYQFLYQKYILYKRKVTEKTDIASLYIDFPIEDIEKNSTMYGYVDVLPYAEDFTLPIDGKQYMFIDQYCVKKTCSCAEATIICICLDEQERTGDQVAAYTVQYNNREWTQLDKNSSELGTIGKTLELKRIIEAAYPKWYDQLRTRHSNLKTIYANCLKSKGIRLPHVSRKTVGRNEPCPCGSGKKFKKCCLSKTQIA